MRFGGRGLHEANESKKAIQRSGRKSFLFIRLLEKIKPGIVISDARLCESCPPLPLQSVVKLEAGGDEIKRLHLFLFHSTYKGRDCWLDDTSFKAFVKPYLR
jgi:hypothetical protein